MSTLKVLKGQSATVRSSLTVSMQQGGHLTPMLITAATFRVRTPSTALPETFSSASFKAVTWSAQTGGDGTRPPREGDDILWLTQASGAAVVLDEGDILIVVADNANGDSDPVAVVQPFVVEIAQRFTLGGGDPAAPCRLREPIPAALPDGATLRPMTVSASLTTGQTSDTGEGVVEWRVTASDINGASTVHDWATPLWVVERIIVPTLTWSRLTARYPIVETLREDNDVNYGEVIASAWDDRIVATLEAKGMAEERIVSAAKLESWHAAECVLHLAKQDPARQGAYVELWKAEANEARDLALAGKRFWYDEEQELAGGSELQTGVTSLPAGAQFVRFSR